MRILSQSLLITGCFLIGSQCIPAQMLPGALPEPETKTAQKIRLRAKEDFWAEKIAEGSLTRTVLTQSIELARAYYLNQQQAEGNFAYMRDIVMNKTQDVDDDQVRQAGALWGLSSLNRDRHTDATRHAVVRGLDFYFRCSKPLKFGHIAPVYPAADDVASGAVSLTCLAIVELWRGQEQYLTGLGRGLYESWLDTYLGFLQGMELDDGSWGQRYVVQFNERDPESSPYYDGETLLAYCKAARYMGHKELIPKIERIAPLLAQRYTIDAWKNDPDSEDTAGFFHWGCMAFAEHVEAGWEHADVIGDAALALGWWVIYEHEIESYRGNTAFAVEGLLGAYRVARARGDHAAMQRFREVSEKILAKLISWQVGGPFEDANPFLRTTRISPDAVGGFMSSKNSGVVHIDTMQHQLNAMLMALDLLFPE